MNKTEGAADIAQIATSSKRPVEFIEKEEQEVRRKSAVNERAMSLAQTHRRFSLMEDQGRASGIDTNGSADEKEVENGHKEEV